MAVFRVFETGDEIFWTLHDNPADQTSGQLGRILATSPQGFDTLQDVLNDLDRVRLVAPGAQVVIEDTVDVLSQGNVRVGQPRVEARRLPATPLASPSSLATEVDTGINVEEDEDDAAPALLVPAAAQPREAPSTGGTVRARTGRSTKTRPPRAKPGTNR